VTDELHKLTPARQQVERALEQGYDVAAFNLYYANIREEVPMVEGDKAREVSVWPEWHRMVSAKMPEVEVRGERVANEEADSLGLEGEERDDYVGVRIDELNETPPGIVERFSRNERGEVVGSELVPNPDA
jgi:hypothetical protein